MNILLTGKPGIGKTSAIKKIAESIGYENVDGFFSEEIRVKGRRTGFRIITFNGLEGVLARISQTDGSKVGKYRVCVSDIESVAIPSLEKARSTGKTIIIDEMLQWSSSQSILL
ncbi:MAG: nucleoside-triphosphatase, partial [Candidatus Thorarchaeota archaeon]